jgi:hypothetical protein
MEETQRGTESKKIESIHIFGLIFLFKLGL